ncbi:glycosyltransferase [Yinghuangia sp. ASG 101]|uniref:glycosyltransferase family 2 protein n=1 Tax=Yinghuangia sp. ASG 101 TaxID=2896848 RepID=UPI001E5F1433|nr:glycosyltransferase family A protein [Yinghuangia sp. ASG 101]UGQ10590.1 glycosyltransferase [Yinghuangia sp. ASG 101]
MTTSEAPRESAATAPALPSVSVVVPSYNYARYLPSNVGSLLDQEGVDVRVLVLDDASTDETPDVGAELARDPRVTYERHTTNKGHIATYNEGLLEWADGDFCVLLSADDLLTPGALARATAVMAADPDVTFVYGNPVRFLSGGPLPDARTGARSRTWTGDRWIRGVFRAGRNLILSPEVVARTGAHHDAGGYNPRLPHSGDLEMWLRLARRGSVGWLPDADQAYYRIHDSNMHHSAFDARARLEQLRDGYESFLDNDGKDLPYRNAIHTAMRRKLARGVLRKVIRTLDAGEDTADGLTVRELYDLAAELTDLRKLPEYPGVRTRMAIGPRHCRRLNPVTSLITARRGRDWIRWHGNRVRPV